MSLRGTKRASAVRGEEAGASKRRRTETEDALWQLRPVSDLKMSSIYNRSASEAPAELFRKDLISAMKLPDSEPLVPSEYWIITDTWKQDWERGVQVPVNPDSLPAPKVKIIDNPLPPNFQDFKLPKDKYIHLTRDAHYQAEKHQLSTVPVKAEAACSYDLDATDTAWLKLLNAERARAGAQPVTEDQLERVIEELEVRTWDKIQAIMKSEEGLGIEYDENVICDVCRSPDSEDGNEMVFCDSCNICVHQACYGITVIPDGQWLCRPCGDGVRPTCVLCPNLGGAMKCTPSGHKWAHVSCVLWIPEVSIGCAEKMEPITKISSIPASRWSLVCVLCRERKGACIQCSVKTCKTAYHVTCAFKHGLEMRAIIEDENADDGVKLRSYCQKHSVNSKKDKCAGSGSEEEEVKRKRRKDMTSEEKTQARAARLHEIEKEFDRHVSVKDISTHLLDVDQDAINYIYNYWKLKRRAGYNRPLLPPKSDDNELLTHRQEQADLDKMKMFVQLRQDLERVRNLCYMVSRREKLSRSFFRYREQTFHKQVAVLSAEVNIPSVELNAIIEANHGPSIYDRLYSHPDAPDHKNDFDDLLARIAPIDSADEKKKDRNGLIKNSKSSNPYKKHYVNGSRRSGSIYSGLSSEESVGDFGRSGKYRGRTIGSSTDDDDKKSIGSPKKKVSPKMRSKKSPKKSDKKKKKVAQSKALVESSSEEDSMKSKIKSERSNSKTLQMMEKEMAERQTGQSNTDSDDLMPIKYTRNSKFPVDIYSDSSEDMSEVKSEKIKPEKFKPEKSPNENDSQQSLPRTKAAMKEFIPEPDKKSPEKTENPSPKKRGRKPSNKDKVPIKTQDSDEDAKDKENIKITKQKDNPTDLIVPQRQAAKKASENMRSTTIVKKEEVSSDKPTSGDDTKSKLKPKPKGKEMPKDKQMSPAKITRKKSSKDNEKELIAYVPQRQAAKKAVAHIKSGFGGKIPVTESTDEKKKEVEKSEPPKASPKKETTKSSKTTPLKDSSSSSSNSSSSSYSSSSSSEEEQDKPEMKPTAKAREIKPNAVQHSSLFSPAGPRPTVDLPFLDKVSRPLSSTSASSDSDSSKGSRTSGTDTPTPKRPRRRRKRPSISTDASPRKAPDKKLKTSERRSECRVPSPVTEGEEHSRHDNARAATRSRTRSITASGNMSNKPDTRQRKPSKDRPIHDIESDKNKESSQSRELPATERQKDKEVKMEKEDFDHTKVKVATTKTKKRSESIEDKNKTQDILSPTQSKTSPRKSSENKQKSVSNRRMSVKDPIKEMTSSSEGFGSLPIKDRRISRQDNAINSNSNINKNHSPVQEPMVDIVESKTPPRINDSYEKNWLSKAPSPICNTQPIDKIEQDKYNISEDKSLDSDSADKNSMKMIAKIQANLNENTMIKSPKTPMDARTLMHDSIDLDNSLPSIRKRTDSDKKYITQDASHVQGVEISKSAKIPSSVNAFPNRSIFSPQPNVSEFFELDNMLGVDDGFNDDMKKFPTCPEILFKEDSKEQGVQETLNLVDRLRMQLTKKAPNDNAAKDENSILINDEEKGDNIGTRVNFGMGGHITPPASKNSVELLDRRMPLKEAQNMVNHLSPAATELSSHIEPRNEVKDLQPAAITNRWQEIPAVNSDGHDDQFSTKYIEEKNMSVTELQSASEIGDNISKQSDDSQSLSVVDNSLHSNDHEATQEGNQNYDNNNSLIQTACSAISSPYVGPECKLRESKITIRRSSASSSNSEGSVCSQKPSEMKSNFNNSSHQSTIMPDIDSYHPPMQPYSCEQSIPMNQYPSYGPDSSPFFSSAIGNLSMFASPSPQLPLGSTATGMYAPGMPFTSTPMIQSMPKQSAPPSSFQNTMCAAFTSSSQNIALTTAMIAPPTPKPVDSPRDDVTNDLREDYSPSVSVESYNDSSNRAPTKLSNDSNDSLTQKPLQESISPAKPTKLSNKFSGKSPGKSPGISPKQSEAPKGPKRVNNRNNRGQRGRGRSKSRGQGVVGFHHVDYMGNSIQSKLVGTVYDFDEEISKDDFDLKALREKRKSVDIREDRKSEHSFKDTSQPPHVLSPHQNNKKSSNERDKPNSPEPREQTKSPNPKPSTERSSGFSQVQPVLPGPVHMHTYHPFENPVPATGEAYHSHLLSEFASGTADQQLPEFDEDSEKQLHSALMASKPAPTSPTPVVPISVPVEPVKEPQIPQLPKVSLSDSRNQLKVKIKGPFLDANYSASSVPTVAPQPAAPTLSLDSNTTMFGASSMSASGSTNLRRMRKKELLRQYWTQDMNMDEPGNTTVVPPPAAPPAPARAHITIPKAVASMTSIPTREDYKLTDTAIEKKKRKTTSGLSRELRHLEVSMNDDVEPTEVSKLPSFSSSLSQVHKRRGRVNTKPNKSMPIAPKLKIKIGNIVQPVNDESTGDQFRPPKKRLVTIPKPSLEDLRRESMKYRKMVMADFGEAKKKKHKDGKVEKRKKKKEKRSEKEKLQVINSESDSATKLIIKIKRTKEEEASVSSAGLGASEPAVTAAPEPPVDPFEYDPTAPDPLAIDPPSYSEASSSVRKIRTAKVTPIRLKLARSSQGSGYVMKDSEGAPVAPPGEPPPEPAPEPSKPVLNKHSVVR